MSFESVKVLMGSSRYADATEDDGWTSDGPSRSESVCHRLCTSDKADSRRDEVLFFAKQRPRESRAAVFIQASLRRAPNPIG